MSTHSVAVEVPGEEYWRKQIRCQYACPVHTDARGYVRAIAAGEFERAYLIARGPNPLASICGRVCGAPCEATCRRGDVDEAISIRALKRFVTEQFGPESRHWSPLALLQRVLDAAPGRQCSGDEELGALRELLHGLQRPPDDAPRVAIIGSGPAGLAAAHDLALLGIRSTVFEMEPIPAGMLALGIPAYRLPRELIEAEIEVIRALGVHFECNVQVGVDISLAELRERFAATIIAVGAKSSRRLQLPGAEGPGVLGGVEFLRDVALGNAVELGGRVVVIGGGNVAYDVSRSVIRQAEMDVSRTALRQAAVESVTMVSLESLEEMPADDVEIIEGDEEGVRRLHRLGPRAVLRDPSGAVGGVEFQRALHVFDENGRFAPTFDASDTVTVEADTVLWAIGQQPDLSFLPEDGDIARDERGNISCDPLTLSTTAPDVFVAGDIAHGARLLIDAVASGKRAARRVRTFLEGRGLGGEHDPTHAELTPYQREPGYEKLRREELQTLSASERKRSQEAVIELGYAPATACREASRCLDCGVNTIFDSDKCILCGGCADICPELCLRLVPVTALEGDGRLQDVLEARYDTDELAEASAIIKDETRCIRCALCAERCPVGAITMERYSFRNRWMEVPS